MALLYNVFFGYTQISIGYIVGSSKKILGLSKLARIADVYARRLQVQERIGQQIAEDIMKYTDALGVGVYIEASHMCMVMRGVEKTNSLTVSTCYLGSMQENYSQRNEFLTMLKR